MKTDNFDEAFRRKVESFHPPFRDDEIDRVQAYVNQHIPLSFWQRFGHTFAYSAGSIIIVSLLTSTLYQANENKNLLNKIQNLTKQSEQKPAIIVADDVPKSTVSSKTDTVYVIKYITKDSPFATEDGVASQPFVESIESSFTENLVINTNKEPLKKQSDETKLDNKRLVENAPNNSQQSGFVVENKQQNNITNQAEIALNNNEIVLQEKSINLLIINELDYKKIDFIDSETKHNLANRKLVLPEYITQPNQGKTNKLPTIALPNLKYRVGLGTNADASLVGTGILTDILFAKHWSLTTGVNVAFLDFERFGSEADFKRKKDKDFRQQYPITIPASNQIEGIETRQLLFRVPIYLNYRWALRKNYTALFSTGTDLDFSLQKFTSYSHHGLSREDNQDGFEEKLAVIPFNNWLVSAGVEKRWNHFSLQLSPYFSTQVKKVSYQKQDYSFGIRLNGFYRLNK